MNILHGFSRLSNISSRFVYGGFLPSMLSSNFQDYRKLSRQHCYHATGVLRPLQWGSLFPCVCICFTRPNAMFWNLQKTFQHAGTHAWYNWNCCHGMSSLSNPTYAVLTSAHVDGVTFVMWFRDDRKMLYYHYLTTFYFKHVS